MIIIRKITIMKRTGRLLLKIEFITVVELTAVALVVGSSLAAGILEIFCKACVALVNAAVASAKALVVFWVIFVAFSKALVAFANVPVTFSDMALVAFAVLVNPAVIVVRDLLALDAGKEELASTFSEDKFSMNNKETRAITEIVFMYTLFVLLKR
jgi:hypothetical protein